MQTYLFTSRIEKQRQIRNEKMSRDDMTQLLLLHCCSELCECERSEATANQLLSSRRSYWKREKHHHSNGPREKESKMPFGGSFEEVGIDGNLLWIILIVSTAWSLHKIAPFSESAKHLCHRLLGPEWVAPSYDPANKMRRAYSLVPRFYTWSPQLHKGRV